MRAARSPPLPLLFFLWDQGKRPLPASALTLSQKPRDHALPPVRSDWLSPILNHLFYVLFFLGVVVTVARDTSL